jgi:hypothetical protein
MTVVLTEGGLSRDEVIVDWTWAGGGLNFDLGQTQRRAGCDFSLCRMRFCNAQNAIRRLRAGASRSSAARASLGDSDDPEAVAFGPQGGPPEGGDLRRGPWLKRRAPFRKTPCDPIAGRSLNRRR